jgi:hypothetical protein
MYTLTQIERQIDPGRRSCTDIHNGGNLNNKCLHLSSEYNQF